MKIAFWSVGKAHDKNLVVAIEDFSNRISNYFNLEWQIIAPAKNAGSLSVQQQKKLESEQILSQLQKEDCLILLDETGKMLSSIELANLIQQKANASTRKLIFLIGGAFGVDENIKERANTIWSLSKLVFPHMIVRLILAEQVYRACTILKNEKYHHS